MSGRTSMSDMERIMYNDLNEYTESKSKCTQNVKSERSSMDEHDTDIAHIRISNIAFTDTDCDYTSTYL